MEESQIAKTEILNQEIPKKTLSKVTKEKNPGRVEAGKRLAEHNRLKKLEAKNKESKERILSQQGESKEEDIEPKQESTLTEMPEVNIYKTSDIVYLVLAGMIGGGLYFGNKIFQKWRTPKDEIKVTEKPEKRDPFFME